MTVRVQVKTLRVRVKTVRVQVKPVRYEYGVPNEDQVMTGYIWK